MASFEISSISCQYVNEECCGGSVCLCADGAVVNCSHIECEPIGRIVVHCRQFVSAGVTAPEPEVLNTNGTEQRDIEKVNRPPFRSALSITTISTNSIRSLCPQNGMYVFPSSSFFSSFSSTDQVCSQSFPSPTSRYSTL